MRNSFSDTKKCGKRKSREVIYHDMSFKLTAVAGTEAFDCTFGEIVST